MTDTVLINNTNTVVESNTEYNIVNTNSTESLVIQSDNASTVVKENADAVVQEVLSSTTVVTGLVGERGRTGESVTFIPVISSINVGGNRLVALDATGQAYYPNMLTDYNVLGITTTSAIAGTEVSVQIAGTMVEPSWNWTPSLPLFADSNGLMTQTPPATGILVVVGYAITASKIMIDKQPPITIG